MSYTSTTLPVESAGRARGSSVKTSLLGIGTAVPHHKGTQATALAFMERVLEASGQVRSGEIALLRRIYSGSGIESRYTVLPDYLETDHFNYTFFPKSATLDPFPGTAARMAVFERESVALAATAGRRALQDAQLAAGRITHLLVVSCTGFFAPGLDVQLIRELGLRPDVSRTILGFMGCYAGVSGMRAADDIVRGNPDAVVLQVCVELCSLHYQKTPTPVTMVANALFSDGAAAAVYGAAGSDAYEAARAEIQATRCYLTPDSMGRMSWRISDTGFVMTLDAAVPNLLKDIGPDFVKALRESCPSAGSITGWAIHPGGRKIVEAVQECLELEPEDVDSSYSVLRDYGNMSSATIFFVLQRELSRTDRSPGGLGVLAFGPGLTVEGCMLERL